MNITSEELALTVQALQKLQPGHLPETLFHAIARLMVLPAIEVVPLKHEAGTVQVLLTRRPEHDSHWPGMLHSPGSILRASDAAGSFETAFDRVLKEELEDAPVLTGPIFFGTRFVQVRRGREAAFLHWAELAPGPVPAGQWHDAYNLPDNLIEHHYEMIRDAADHFKSHKGIA